MVTEPWAALVRTPKDRSWRPAHHEESLLTLPLCGCPPPKNQPPVNSPEVAEIGSARGSWAAAPCRDAHGGVLLKSAASSGTAAGPAHHGSSFGPADLAGQTPRGPQSP